MITENLQRITDEYRNEVTIQKTDTITNREVVINVSGAFIHFHHTFIKYWKQFGDALRKELQPFEYDWLWAYYWDGTITRPKRLADQGLDCKITCIEYGQLTLVHRIITITDPSGCKFSMMRCAMGKWVKISYEIPKRNILPPDPDDPEDTIHEVYGRMSKFDDEQNI